MHLNETTCVKGDGMIDSGSEAVALRRLRTQTCILFGNLATTNSSVYVSQHCVAYQSIWGRLLNIATVPGGGIDSTFMGFNE